MALNFRKNQPNSERGTHHSAIGGNWPNQWRYIIERVGREFRIEMLRHVAGQGFAAVNTEYSKTLKNAKERCEEWNNPKPVDRTASSYTDA